APHPGPGPHPAPRPGPRLPTCRTGHVRAPAPRATGFVLASLAGAVGLGLAIALWVAGAPAVLILAAYLVTPGLALGLIGLCTARIPSRYRREYRRPDFNGCDANV
ncbi:hypothetical protein, partial [Pseudooceanicola sediminis]|uniref:hypothetical protein n=1 Tax=Pseudooceanicola sediminis TaxID=2211117 RepID=UPI001F30FA45